MKARDTVSAENKKNTVVEILERTYSSSKSES